MTGSVHSFDPGKGVQGEETKVLKKIKSKPNSWERKWWKMAREETEAASLGYRNVPPEAPKLTSDVVTPALQNQDWIRVNTKSRNKQRSPDLVASESG